MTYLRGRPFHGERREMRERNAENGKDKDKRKAEMRGKIRVHEYWSGLPHYLKLTAWTMIIPSPGSVSQKGYFVLRVNCSGLVANNTTLKILVSR